MKILKRVLSMVMSCCMAVLMLHLGVWKVESYYNYEKGKILNDLIRKTAGYKEKVKKIVFDTEDDSWSLFQKSLDSVGDEFKGVKAKFDSKSGTVTIKSKN